MKQDLAHIYQALAAGRLSQDDALQAIKAIKRDARRPASPHGTLLAVPRWEAAALPEDAGATGPAHHTHHHVVLVGLPGVDAPALASALALDACGDVILAGGSLAAAFEHVALACFAALKRVLAARPAGPCLIQWVFADGEQAELWAGLYGLLQTAAQENPDLIARVLVVPASISTDALSGCLRAERAGPLDAVVRHGGGGRQVLCWRTLPAYADQAPDCVFKEHGVYLITGGLGGLGVLMAREILGSTSGARVVLSGRSEAGDDRLAGLDPRGAGGRVSYRQADVCDAAQVDALVEGICAEHGRLDGIVHAAGVLHDAFILTKSEQDFRAVLQPKTAGTENLDRASRELALDFFVLCSSIASWAGNVGQADYASANGFMDRFARYRNAQVAAGLRRGRTLSLGWPHWADGGMHIDALSMAALQARTGLRSISTAEGLRVLAQALALDHDHVLVLHGDTAQMQRALEHRSVPRATAPVARPASAAPEAPLAELSAAASSFLREELATLLKIPPQRIETQAALEQYGIDSILAMSLTSQLEKTFGPLPKTLFFEYQTLDDLAGYFVRSHADTLRARQPARGDAPRAAEVRLPAPDPVAAGGAGSRRSRSRFAAAPDTRAARPAADEPIAIVGLSGRYPRSPDLAAFWRNLSEGRDCIVEVPAERWDWRAYFSEDRTREGAHFSKWGGFIDGADEFDPRFFNIAPREARSIDPQERLFLQHAWMAIEDAGLTRAALQRPDPMGMAGQVGVYAGVMYGEYNLSGSLASIANRVSYFLNLHGPSLTLDTMCSSSLTALHLACQDLRLGRTALALAGGVNLSIHPNKYAMLSGGQFISGDGHCQSFGEGGDGYIPGEGVGVAVLMRLADAERDGHHIYGLIRGSALNHGGKTNGYTVPNPGAQAEVIRRALAGAGVDPRHVSYIEAHGTGTKLGDPIEIAALSKAFQEGSRSPGGRDTGFCRIGSAKSNIGHCESAAGIAGVTKVLLQLKHRAIVPSLHSRKLNPHIDFAATPFVVNQSLCEWRAPELDGRRLPRIAGVSSFGAGGSNAHVIIEEYTPPAREAAAGSQTVLIPLSARTAGQLQARAGDLLALLEDSQQAVDLEALAWTLQIGREAMDERAAFVVSDPQQLAGCLRALRDGASDPAVFRAQVRPHREAVADLRAGDGFAQTLERWFAGRQLATLAEWWVKGLEIDWRRLPGPAARPRLLSLPAYPFARERYWQPPGVPVGSPVGAAPVLHPLLHTNMSTLERCSFRSVFDGNEGFVEADTRAGGPAIAPLAALDIAREAVARATSEAADGDWVLNGVQWGEPFEVGGGRAFDISVWARSGGASEVQIAAATTDGAADTVHLQAGAGRLVLPPPAPVAPADLRTVVPFPTDAGDQVLLGEWAEADRLHVALCLPEAEPLRGAVLLRHLGAALDRWFGEPVAPRSLAQVHFASALPVHAVACVRRQGAGLDIRVCDQAGRVSLALTGLHVAPRHAGCALAEPPAVVVHGQGLPRDDAGAAVQPAPEVRFPREVALRPRPTLATAALAVRPVPPKPVTPLCSAATPPDFPPARRKGRIALPAMDAAAGSAVPTGIGDTTVSLKIAEIAAGVFRVDLCAPFGDAIDALCRALEQLQHEASLRALLLSGMHPEAWRGGRAEANHAVASGLFAAVTGFPVPVLAVMPGGAAGPGLLLAACCDFMVCSEEAQYGFADLASGLSPTVAEDAFFRERFGDPFADDLLYRRQRCTGAQLAFRGGAGRVLPAGGVEAGALALVAALADKPPLALRLLKAHLARGLRPHVAALDQAAPQAVALEPAGEAAVHLIRLASAPGESPAGQWLAALEQGLAHVSGEPGCAAVVLLADADPQAMPEPTPEVEVAAIRAFMARVRQMPVPVIAALTADARGSGWLAALCCDAVVHNRSGHYAASPAWLAPGLAREVRAWSQLRLGLALGVEVTLAQAGYSGAELEARLGAMHVAAADQVPGQARALAAAWGAVPRDTLHDWRQRQWARAAALELALPASDAADPADEAAAGTVDEPVPLALASTVVSAVLEPGGVVRVVMHDREARNMFSAALVEGLKEAFACIAGMARCKVVVLTGYDSYFATGGTMDTLLAIQDGQARFTDERVFQLPMDCPLPVIAAMQGHGIGGGWSFGMFSDLVLLSAESRYLSPYMGYGFTPGAGSTLVLPARIGLDLARETLLCAQEVSGQSLRQRGVPLAVLPRHDVLAAAMALAQGMARLPRERLVAMKALWAAPLRAAREEVYRREVQMHDRTFVGNAETLARIHGRFGDEKGTVLPAAAPAADARDPAAVPAPGSVVATLRRLLAEELFLQPEEIDEDTPFIDLGLDSITGVTWVRRISAHYGVEIEATKVYSHPTLRQLAGLVLRKAPGSGPAPEPAPVADVADGRPASATAVRTPPQPGSPGLAAVVAQLRDMLAQELLLPAGEIEDSAQFIDLGLDSITGVTWVRKINERFGIAIEATKVYSHPTLRDIARLVIDEAGEGLAPARTGVPAAVPAPPVPAAPRAVQGPRALADWRTRRSVAPATAAAPTSQAIAVIGMAGQFPQAEDVDSFWGHLAAGRDCISVVPPTRWDVAAHFQPGAPAAGKTNSKWLGALADFDCFDPLFFNISPGEAECIEPQQRLFLQACWHAIEHAGYAAQALSGSACGVFVGCGPSDYHQGSPAHQLSAQGFTGAATSILAARIAYFLNLRGPCLAIDTACSSSLVAIASACDSLAAGNSTLALAGGVYVMGGPAMHIMTAQAGMLSVDGRCYSFDQRANGFVPGEAVGVLVLKRLADAQRDGDRVLAVIEGWGVNQDGKSNGITAPNEAAQAELLQSVYRRFGIDPAGIQLVEAHGTGTKLGDPIEVSGLKTAFRAFTDRAGYCAIGSVKSNIGHCLTAAGAAGIIKLILALQHRALPPTIHYTRCNEHIDLDGSPFYVNDSLKAWSVGPDERRRAAISAFGFSGTNAHMVLAEPADAGGAQRPAPHTAGQGPCIVPLSARTEAQLRLKAEALLASLRSAGPVPDLVDVAYTLQVGRDHMAERLGILADSVPELCRRLEGWLRGEAATGVCQGQVRRSRDELRLIVQDEEMRDLLVARWRDQGRLDKLLELWAKGLDLDWAPWYPQGRPRRVALPLYPFARERYRLPAAPQPATGAVAGPRNMLHPLLHENVSELGQQRYRSVFSGAEPCFESHADGRRLMSPDALLDMLHAAFGNALPGACLPRPTHSDVEWLSPLACGSAALTVQLALWQGGDERLAFEITSGEPADTVHLCGSVALPADGGQVAEELPALTAAPPERAETVMLAPQWDVVALPACEAPGGSGHILLVGADAAQQAAVEAFFAGVPLTVADLSTAMSVEAVCERLGGAGFDRVIWIGHAQAATALTEESLIADQEQGILALLRLVRALARIGYEQRALRLDLITIRSLPVLRSDRANPAHAGVHGFAGSLAEVYPRWTVHPFDLDALHVAALTGIEAVAGPARSETHALRGAQWLVQRLVPVQALAPAAAPYRHRGVYVVIGGSGGLGEVWSRHLIARHDASVIWIGRRPLDAGLQRKLDSFAALGRVPEYIQADATDLAQLEAAYAHIRARHAAIHGVVHSAVGAFDQSLKSVAEADFRAILAVKIDLSVRIAQVFGREALDFLLCFSSNASFVRGAGMSGYSAGCAFKDAFALQWGRSRPCTVKVVNWGYWSVGAGEAMTDAMKAYFHAMGYRPLDPAEGMAALDAFMASGFEQLSIGRNLGPVAGHLQIADEWMAAYGGTARGAADIVSAVSTLDLRGRFEGLDSAPGAEMETLLVRLLKGILDTTPAVLPSYGRWLDEARQMAAPVQDDRPLELLWQDWSEAMARWAQLPGKQALCALMDACMRNLPAILSGARKATDVIFPDGSLDLVERFYKTDAVSLAYNDCLRAALVAAVEALLRDQPEARIRMLEIGAGTGATTVGLLDALEPFRAHIEEYCYTDLSRAFLLHADRVYAVRAPYLHTQRFDASRPLAGQGLAPGGYDFVIAANVLHATHNIRTTLRNAKALLRRGGVLLLNEISDRSICAHLSFGLLGGWWLNEDDAIRIPGSPALYEAGWRSVLQEEGFHGLCMPCEAVRISGQQHQIILAGSDGIVRQKSEPALVPAVPERHAPTAGPVPATPDDAGLRDRTLAFCRQLVGKALKIDPLQIEPDEPLERYGIDSISIGLVNQQLQDVFGPLSATLLYEFRTVDALAGHLLEAQRDTLLARLPGPQAPARPLPAARQNPVPAASRRETTPDDATLRARTVALCKQAVGAALKIGPEQLDAGEPLERYGIDSISIGLVNQRLQQHFGELSATLLYEFRTIEALAGHLVDQHRETLLRTLGSEAPAAAATARAPARSAPAGRPAPAGVPTARRAGHGLPAPQAGAMRAPIAIVGISGTYPLAADLDEFWDNLRAGRNCITEIPAVRWGLEHFYEPDEHAAVEAGKSYCKWGGFVDQFAEFDSLFFGIPPREAHNMDPQERMFMQAAWRALENAGYTRHTLRQLFGGRVGVFAGITRAGYNLYRNTQDGTDKFWPRTSFSSVANRLSYFLDIHGPSLPVDTMCSSSLTAIHEACEHIHQGDCDLAIAGGVNLYLHPTSYADMSSQHMLSRDGVCRSFGEGANGFVPGEGVGVVLLKRLDHALRDQDIVHGVILATQVNHGGKTNGFTVPNPQAQAELVRAAIRKAGIRARDISYIEAHGTGTELGDPIEIAGLQQAFAADTADKGFCRVGSAKSGIGHLEAAAGIAGLTKVLLQFKHRQIAPSLHATEPNRHIRFEQTAFVLNGTLAAWEAPVVDGRPRPRIAGVSSFGAGGANAHVLVQEFEPVPRQASAPCRGPDEPVVVPLSARSAEQLQQKVSDLLDHLRLGTSEPDLDAVAYTLQVGREAMDMRVAFLASSVAQLSTLLSDWLDGRRDAEGVFHGQARRSNDGVALFAQDEELAEALDKWVARRKYGRLLQWWVKGLEFDWNRLYDDRRPRRVELPTYPFAKDAYWLEQRATPPVAPGAGASGVRADMRKIEEIISRIDDASIEAAQGVALLKKLV